MYCPTKLLRSLMNKSFLAVIVRLRVILLAVCLLTVSAAIAVGQQSVPVRPMPADRESYDRAKAVPVEQSRAQQEADRLVSLSADKIVSLLNDEPGLLLECKKLLVRTAFSQGRVLTADDLTDDAVFGSVREDVNVRVLFTQEIQDRDYVRAKPTKEELERDYREGRTRVPDPSQIQQLGQPDLKTANNDEERYWLRHERDVDRTMFPSAANLNASSSEAQAQQQNPYALMDDQQRALLQMESPDSFYDGFGEGRGGGALGGGGEQLPALLSTQMQGGGLGGGSGDDRARPQSRFRYGGNGW